MNAKKCNRLGETNVAINGMKMQIIAYHNANNVDIQFENGEIIKGRSYQNFKNGSIRGIKSKIGETGVATNGMKMKIIAYRGYNDVDIQFENGEIIKGRSYQNFKNGKICSKVVKRDSRLGETNVATNGMKMEIIAYRNSQDVDIQFENGEIVKGKKYHDFKKGYIRSKLVKSNIKSNIKSNNCFIKKQRLGEETISNSGMKMKIIKYRSAKDIDVQFEDGTVVKHRWYRRFQTGSIRNPSCSNKLGEKSIAKCGKEMVIIRYRSSMDIDVQFEDGVVVYNKTYYCFKTGQIGHPDICLCKKQRLGEEIMSNSGMKMKIIAYRSHKDIDVQFEDGTVAKHKLYRNFQTGSIRSPINRIGEKSMANCGMEMTIIRYRSSMDIDVQFKDGVVACNKTYQCFKTGQIRYPNVCP